jgi:ketosteroid isomerase-like protein
MQTKETAIEALEERLRQALLDSDISTLDELIADDLLFTLPTGLVIDKQTDLDAHRFGIQKFIRVEIVDRQLHHWAN